MKRFQSLSLAAACACFAACFAPAALADEPPPADPLDPPEGRAVPTPSPSVRAGKPKPLDEGAQLHWKGKRFSTLDYVITLTGGALTLGAAIVHPQPKHSFQGPILFDDAARRTLRAGSISERYQFRDASDVGVSLAVTWPFFADALTTAWWFRGSRDVAEQMALVSLQTLAIAGAVQGVTNVVASRERPFGDDCGSEELPSEVLDCEGSFHYRSFFSGHATNAFTGAALVCIHHFENELLGPPWDAVSCAGSYAVAATTATFRIVSDMHYASDVLTGALLGTLIGYGVPLLHYRTGTATSSAAGSVEVTLVPAAGGVGLFGTF